MVKTTADFIFPAREVDDNTKRLLEELYEFRKDLHEYFTLEEFINQYEAWRRSVSQSFDSYLENTIRMIKKLKYAAFKF